MHNSRSLSPRFFQVLKDEEIVQAIRAGHKLPGRVQCKGAILDLFGLQQVLTRDTPEGMALLTVRRLLKLGRTDNRVSVLVNPCEEFSSLEGVLGNECDEQFRVVSEEHYFHGKILILELMKKRKHKIKKRMAPPPRTAEVVFVRAQRNKRHPRITYVILMRKGRRNILKVKSRIRNSMMAKLEAMARMAEVHCSSIIAIPAHRNLCAALLEGTDKPRFVGLFDAVRDLNMTHSWTLTADGAWLLGTPRELREHGG